MVKMRLRHDTVPALVGRRLGAANEMCERLGIEVLVDNDVEWPSWQGDAPGPLVVEQWPAAGERVDEAPAVLVVRVVFDSDEAPGQPASVPFFEPELWR